MADGPELGASDVFPELKLEGASDLATRRTHAEQRAIQQAIAESGGHLGSAAKRLGISRTTLWKKLRATREDDGGTP